MRVIDARYIVSLPGSTPRTIGSKRCVGLLCARPFWCNVLYYAGKALGQSAGHLFVPLCDDCAWTPFQPIDPQAVSDWLLLEWPQRRHPFRKSARSALALSQVRWAGRETLT